MQTDVLDKILYSDDVAKLAKTEKKMQEAMDRVSAARDNYDLTISKIKTEVVYQPAHGKPYSEPTITVLNSPIWEALCPELCTLMMRLLPESLKPV